MQIDVSALGEQSAIRAAQKALAEERNKCVAYTGFQRWMFALPSTWMKFQNERHYTTCREVHIKAALQLVFLGPWEIMSDIMGPRLCLPPMGNPCDL